MLTNTSSAKSGLLDKARTPMSTARVHSVHTGKYLVGNEIYDKQWLNFLVNSWHNRTTDFSKYSMICGTD